MKRYNRNISLRIIMMLLAVIIVLSSSHPIMIHASEAKQLIYDDAGLLTESERADLETLAAEYGAERETDIIIVTSKNSENADVMKMTQDFYDEQAPGFDKPHGNAVVLMMDMNNREIYLAGFGIAEQSLDDMRLDKIRDKITPSLSDGAYATAFEIYVETSYKYLGIKPGVNPDNILFTLWFQLLASIIIAAIVVGIMAYRSGGRVTVNHKTYEEAGSSGVIKQSDQYLHTTTTKQKIQKNESGGGGGGGTTGGGSSHSGSRGSF